MEDEKVVTVNIENYTGEKPIEVIVRKGEAAKAVDPLPEKRTIEVQPQWNNRCACQLA